MRKPWRKVRGSTATYRSPHRKNDVCDLDELAKTYTHIGRIPERVGWLKACEISLLAIKFGLLTKEVKTLRSRLKSVTS